MAVGVLLAVAAAAVAIQGGLVSADRRFVQVAHVLTIGVSLAFAGRAVGDFRVLGLFKKVRGTRFARADDRIFVPICVGIAAAAAWVSFR